MKEKIIHALSKPSIIFASFCFVVMYIFVFMGNPKIAKGNAMCWHHIPEIAGIYFVGVWARQVKFSFRHVFLVFALTTTLMPVTVVGLSADLFWGMLIALPISFPLLLGYIIQKTCEK